MATFTDLTSGLSAQRRKTRLQGRPGVIRGQENPAEPSSMANSLAMLKMEEIAPMPTPQAPASPPPQFAAPPSQAPAQELARLKMMENSQMGDPFGGYGAFAGPKGQARDFIPELQNAHIGPRRKGEPGLSGQGASHSGMGPPPGMGPVGMGYGKAFGKATGQMGLGILTGPIGLITGGKAMVDVTQDTMQARQAFNALDNPPPFSENQYAQEAASLGAMGAPVGISEGPTMGSMGLGVTAADAAAAASAGTGVGK